MINDWKAIAPEILAQNRGLYVGSSDAAALFGKHPSKSYFTLWHEKKGGIAHEVEENEAMKWGKRLESAIAHGFADDFGLIIKAGELVKHPSIAGMAATPDFYIYNAIADAPESPYLDLLATSGPGILEVKNVSQMAHLKGWSDEEATAYIEIQVQHQMACDSSITWAVICPLIGGNKLKPIIKHKDPEFITILEGYVKALWESDTPPEPDGSASSWETVQKILPEPEKDMMGTIDDAELMERLYRVNRDYKFYSGCAAKLEDLLQELKSKVALRMGSAGVACGAGVKVERKRIKRAGYSVVACEYDMIKVSSMGEVRDD
jgi:predicted phage-related endonuclease